jgi:hypothetical protein
MDSSVTEERLIQKTIIESDCQICVPLRMLRKVFCP